jgi:hypothetical protein
VPCAFRAFEDARRSLVRLSFFILRIHIRTVCDKQFDDFHATGKSRTMQRSRAFFVLRIHIRTSSDVLLDGFDVSIKSSIPN